MRNSFIGVLVSILMLCPQLVAEDSMSSQIAYVDLDQVFSSSLVNTKLENLKKDFQSRQNDFEAARDRLQKMQADFEKESAAMTKIVRENRELEIKEMAAKLSQQGSEMSNEFFMQQKQIQADYMKQVTDISKFLADKYGIKVIYAKQGLLYISEDLDLTEELIRELK